ncbi:hypothetical protein [Sporosarcina sp. E16_8]|uniref:hypothetical protein n=1 Tax=Sporosarcina sp. E16_8 TaxID=2789295 RepID=UPI002102D47D|nr:hypothetical protein [Sporosarcina sp. E16_8]
MTFIVAILSVQFGTLLGFILTAAKIRGIKFARKIATGYTTILVVTHEMDFTKDIANKVLFMDGGVAVVKGAPHEIFVNPKEERSQKFLNRVLP